MAADECLAAETEYIPDLFQFVYGLSAAAAAGAGRVMRGATWWSSSSTLIITSHEYIIYHSSLQFLHLSAVYIIVSEAYSSDCHQDIVSRGGAGRDTSR